MEFYHASICCCLFLKCMFLSWRWLAAKNTFHIQIGAETKSHFIPLQTSGGTFHRCKEKKWERAGRLWKQQQVQRLLSGCLAQVMIGSAEVLDVKLRQASAPSCRLLSRTWQHGGGFSCEIYHESLDASVHYWWKDSNHQRQGELTGKHHPPQSSGSGVTGAQCVCRLETHPFLVLSSSVTQWVMWPNKTHPFFIGFKCFFLNQYLSG